jgi:hypothetical protein
MADYDNGFNHIYGAADAVGGYGCSSFTAYASGGGFNINSTAQNVAGNYGGGEQGTSFLQRYGVGGNAGVPAGGYGGGNVAGGFGGYNAPLDIQWCQHLLRRRQRLRRLPSRR